MSRLASLREMLEDDPEDAFTRYALAMELKGLGRLDDALAELATLVESQPDYLATYYQYAGMLHASGRSEEALDVIDRGMAVAEAAKDAHTRGELQDLRDEVA